MNKFRKSSLVVLFIMALFLIFAIWYKHTYSMTEAEAFEVSADNMQSKLLIATQGSDFKNSVTQGIVDYYKSDSVFIKVIDILGLDELKPEDFTVILILHTWEYEKPPDLVSSFLKKAESYNDKIVVVTTSGSGTSKMEGVDAITGESILEHVPVVIEKIFSRLDTLLKKAN